MDSVEHKLDTNVSKTEQHDDHIHFLQEQLEAAQTKIDDLENRSRRENFRVRGLPESIMDVHSAIRDIMRILLPSAPDIKLEIDRAHRSLGPMRRDGLPRDVVVKPHYFSTKEDIMKRSRQQENLQYQGTNIQIFSDISPYTIQKRRAMKPLLSALINKNIKYKWAFPFALKFNYNGRNHIIHNFQEGERLLSDLKIISLDPVMDTNPPQLPSAKRNTPTSPTQNPWNKVKYRKIGGDQAP